MTKSQETAFMGTRIPLKMKQEISELVRNGSHLNESDFMRDALRDKVNDLKEDN